MLVIVFAPLTYPQTIRAISFLATLSRLGNFHRTGIVYYCLVSSLTGLFSCLYDMWLLATYCPRLVYRVQQV
jgi:hypothetical protein